MLSITNISSAGQAVHYFEKDDYYAKDDSEHREVSQWFGLGASELGLSGQIEKEDFLKVLEGKLPNGVQLGRQIDGKIEHASGLDLTFSAPKSVSLFSEMKEDKQMAEAHKKAVMRALKYVEKNFVNTRKQEDGELFKEKVSNVIVAMFKHNTSRAHDPQLHTHCVVANAVQRRDGEWRSAEFREIFENKLLIGQVYRSELACELKELGYDIKRTGKGIFEIDGIPDNVLRQFSKRSQAKEEALKEYDYVNSKTAENAVLKTRESKQVTSKEELQKKWLKESKSIGFDIDKAPLKEPDIQEKVKENTGIIDYVQDRFREFCQKFEFNANKLPDHINAIEQQNSLTKEEKAVLYAIKHLSERSTVFSKKDLCITALDCSLGEVKIDQVDATIKKLVENKDLLLGRSKEFENTYTTKEALAKEKDTIGMLKCGMNTQKSLYTKSEISKELKDISLTKGQKEAISLILNTKDRVVGIQGYAGTGKTFMLNKARELIEERGYKCIGLAPSSSAASVLQKEANIESQTLHKFLFKYKGLIEGRGTLAGRQKMKADFKDKIVILDEASLASTTQMQGLLKVSKELNVRGLLIGDRKQKGAVEEGKPFEQCQKAGMQTAIMGDIKRQTNKNLRAIVYDTINAVDRKDSFYLKEAMKKIGNNYIEAKKSSLAWVAANKLLSLSREDRDNTLIIVPNHINRQKVCKYVSKALEREGALSGKKENMLIFDNKNLTDAEKTRAFNYNKGDFILFNRTYKSLGIKKGSYCEVNQVNKYNKIRVNNGKNKDVYWDPSKIGGNRKGAIEVFSPQEINIMKGEKIRWTKNSTTHPEIKNSETATVLDISKKHIKVKLESGETKILSKGDKVFHHISHAYASTVHASQGKTSKNIIGVLESDHKYLTDQRSFYVTLSRAKEQAFLISDNIKTLINTLTQNTGAKISSHEHQKLQVKI